MTRKHLSLIACIGLGCGSSAPKLRMQGRLVVVTSSVRPLVLQGLPDACVPQPTWSVELVAPIVAHLASKHPAGRIRDVTVVDDLTVRDRVLDTDQPLLPGARRRYGDYAVELDRGTVILSGESMSYRYCVTMHVDEKQVGVELELVSEGCVAALVD